MSCCGSKNKKLRVVVIGSDGVEKKEVIKAIQSYHEPTANQSETSVNICCCPCKVQGSPVKIDGLDMVLFNTQDLDDPDYPGDEIEEVEEIKKCISERALHVFLLVLNIEPFIERKREKVELIRATFGKVVTDYMVIVWKGDMDKEDRSEFEKEMMAPKPHPNSDSTIDSNQMYLKDLKADCSDRVVFLYDEDDDPRSVMKMMHDIKEIIGKNKNRGYTHKMMMAECKAEKNEKLPLPLKIGLLLGLWLGALLGVVFFGKDFLQTGVVMGGGLGGMLGKVGPALSKHIRNRLE